MTDVQPEAFYIKQGTEAAIRDTIVSDINDIKMNTNNVIAYDDITTAGSVYFQYADSSIKKWGADNIRYSAPANTKWANRSTATYTAETV